MKALIPKVVAAGVLLLTGLPQVWGSQPKFSHPAPGVRTLSFSERTMHWRGPAYRARPSTSIGVSIYSGPGPYYHRTRDYYPYHPTYRPPVYVTPPPVVYAPPPVVYTEPPIYYGNSVPGPVYQAAPPPPPAPMIDTRLLQVQENLRRLGYYKGMVDGISGPATRNAIRAYQVDRGLPVTGRLDRELLQDLGL